MIRVVPAPGKNVSDYPVTGLRKFVESTFHTKVRLRCDNEPAAIRLCCRVLWCSRIHLDMTMQQTQQRGRFALWRIRCEF